MTENKYVRTIHNLENVDIDNSVQADVYEVLEAFSVVCPARQHAAKKVLCAGIRGKGDATQDLIEARDALNRAIELEIRRVKIEQRKSDLAGLCIPADVRSDVPVAETRTEATNVTTIPVATPSAVRGGQRAGEKARGTTRKR
jgi:hypothetical protein